MCDYQAWAHLYPATANVEILSDYQARALSCPAILRV
jgi:hypothetical protein